MNSTTTSILNSPAFATLLGLLISGIGAILIGIYRVLSRISLLETQVADLGKSVQQIEHDLDVIKWGAVAGANVLRQQTIIPPTEGQ